MVTTDADDIIFTSTQIKSIQEQGFNTENYRTFGNESTFSRGVVNSYAFDIWDKYTDGNEKIGKVLTKIF